MLAVVVFVRGVPFPVFLAHTFLYDFANFALGGAVLDSNGDGAKLRSVHESKFLLGYLFAEFALSVPDVAGDALLDFPVSFTDTISAGSGVVFSVVEVTVAVIVSHSIPVLFTQVYTRQRSVYFSMTDYFSFSGLFLSCFWSLGSCCCFCFVCFFYFLIFSLFFFFIFFFYFLIFDLS